MYARLASLLSTYLILRPYKKKLPCSALWVKTTHIEHRHVQASGANFLNALRVAFSTAFVRKVLYKGRDAYEDATGVPPDASWLEPPRLSADDLWQVRRDIEGRTPNEPARAKAPDVGPRFGMIIFQLQSRGATPEGPYWRLNGLSIRILRTPEEFIHRVKKQYERETAPLNAPDVVICLGAEASSLPSDIVRGDTPPTLARGGPSGSWLTVDEAVKELSL